MAHLRDKSVQFSDETTEKAFCANLMAGGLAEDVGGSSQPDGQFQNDQVRLGVCQATAMPSRVFEEWGVLDCPSEPLHIGAHEISKQGIKLVVLLNTMGGNAPRL